MLHPRRSPRVALAEAASGEPSAEDDLVPVILYHGPLSANRAVEQLMQVLLEPGLQDAHLLLMGVGEMQDEFIRVSAEARWENRVHVLQPVLPAELLLWVASA